MKVFCPTTGRSHAILSDTLKSYPGNVELLIHTEREASQYREAGVDVPIHITGEGPPLLGKGHSLLWCLDNLISDGEWVVFLDDDLKSITSLPEPEYYNSRIPVSSYKAASIPYRHKFETAASLDRVNSIWEETRVVAESVGANMAGFASTFNPYYRLIKWSTYAIIYGWMWMLRKRAGRRYPNIPYMEDVKISLAHLKWDGLVLVNRFMYGDRQFWQEGGYGGLEKRIPVRDAEIREMAAEFGGMVKVVEKESGGLIYKDIRLHPGYRKHLRSDKVSLP